MDRLRTRSAVENDERIESDKRESPQFFIAFRRFEKKTRSAVVDLGESRDRRFHICHQVDDQRDEIAALGEVAKLVEGRRNGVLEYGVSASMWHHSWRHASA